ncbi:MAG: hypothetical protein K6G28_01285 [Acholeplasmatales bacterium]|nr:hypothetical protein [Acholeplasmatales bacterium]
MKLNERLYDELGYLPYKEPELGHDYVPVPSTPIEVQTVKKHQVEIYYMNDYKDVLEEFTRQNKFAVWSSKDGVNYRLAVEKDYYEQVKELYSVKVNESWLSFWDNCDVIQKNFSRRIVLPITALVIAVFLFLANWNNMFKNAQMNATVNLGLTIAIPVVYLVAMMILRRNVINKITLEQQNALNDIKAYFGEKKFDSLLKTQRTYIDSYFEKVIEEPVEKDLEKSENKEEVLEAQETEDSAIDKKETDLKEEK